MVIVAALAMRLIYPGVFIFKEDEARAIVYALRVVRDHAVLTHTWPSSVGIANSPVFVYLLAPFTFFSHSPQILSLCMNVMNLASVGVAYFLFRKIFNDRNEVNLSVLFFAISPVAIHFSRKIWDPVPLPLFAVLLMHAALKVLDRERSRWIFPLLVLSSLAIQIHQSGVFFVALLIAAVAIHAPRLHRGWTAAGTAVGAACVAPYLVYLFNSGLPELAAVRNRFSAELPDIDAVTNYLLNCTGHNIFLIAGYDSIPFLNWPVPGFGAIAGILMLLFIPVSYYGIRELISRSSVRIALRPPSFIAGAARGYNLLLICLLGQPFLYLLFRVPGAAHYYLVLFPVIFCLIPLGMSRIARERPGGRLSRALWILPILWIVISVSFLSMTSYRRGGHSYGPLYRYQREIARQVIDRHEREAIPAVARSARPAPSGPAPDTVAVSIICPRLRPRLPTQWRFVFREICACEPVEPARGPYYEVVLAWERSAWKRGRYTIERIDPAKRQ